MAQLSDNDTGDYFLQCSNSSESNVSQVKQQVMPLLDLKSSIEQRNVVYVKKELSKRAKRNLKWIGIALTILLILSFLLVFVIMPLIFMNSIFLQRLIMFTNWGLPSQSDYFKKYEILPGLRNFYVTVKDLNNANVISIGVWHLVPYFFQENVITDQNFDFEASLHNSSKSVLLYFHGTGEDRSSSESKYRLFKIFFHVITFDYRSYGDSSKSELSETAVVNDCVQLYEWLTTKTDSPIFIWGHSLGTALAAHTVARIKTKSHIPQPVGLVLESAFTRMSEELYVHPYGKLFAWLPWFEGTVIIPLEKNGFLFDTQAYIRNIDYPIMILSAEDDSVVPCYFGEKLYEVAKARTVVNTTLFYKFAYDLNYDHNFIYKDPFVPYFLKYFHYLCINKNDTERESTKIYEHQVVHI